MKYEEIKLGIIAELTHRLTLDDIQRFVELSGDDNRIHTDAFFAAKTSFKNPVAHGMLGAAFISTLIGTKLPGDGAIWIFQSLEFLLPVRVEDMLKIRAEFVKKDDRTKIIELKTEIVNQHIQLVTQGVAKIKVVEQELEQQDAIAKHLNLPQLAQVAIVVGASGAIGSAICLELARAGFDIAVHCFKNFTKARAIAMEI